MTVRVLFFSHSHNMRGGAARSLLELLERSTEKLVACVALPKEGEFSQRCEELGIPFYIVPDVWWVAVGSIDAWLYGMRRLPEAVDSVREIIRRQGIDVVHSNASVSPVGAFAAALESRPHVWHIREFLSKEGVSLNAEPLGFDLLRDLIRSLSNRIIAVSEVLACDFRGRGEDQKVVTIRDGIELSEFSEYHVKENRKILAIGASTPDKGLNELVQAAALLREKGVDARFTVLGNVEPDGYFEEVTRKLSKLGLTDTFHLQGYEPDIGPYLANANIFCLPSRSEGMSRVVLEAMASGLPVVATDCGGPSELFEHGVSGLLCPVGNSQELAKSLGMILQSSELAESLGFAARRHVRNQFEIMESVIKINAVLTEVGMKGIPSEAKAMAQFLLLYMTEAAPRVLLGKKWRLIKPLMR